MPQEKLQLLKQLRIQWESAHPSPHNEEDWKDYAREITQHAERWLDEGHGGCLLREPWAARILAEALMRFQGQRYFTSCYAVLPNHCHALIRPDAGHSLETILQGCKGFVAHELNRRRGRRGSLWQEESYDQIIRDDEHLYRVVQYIGRNPAKAGLPRELWVRWIHPDWVKAGWGFVDE